MARLTGRKPINKSNLKASLGEDNLIWVMVGLFIFCLAITVIGVRFFDSIHFNSQLTKLSSQNASLKNELTQQQTDIKFLLKSNQVNCYDLQSVYAHSICKTSN